MIQPADVGWFKPLKTRYSKKWLQWFIDGEKVLTKHGNLAGPGYKNIAKWLIECWKDINKVDKIHSFQYCGITCDTPDDYHSTLKELLASEKLPPNITVESSEPHDDPNIVNCFVNFDYQDIEKYNEEEDDDYIYSGSDESESTSSEESTDEEMVSEKENERLESQSDSSNESSSSLETNQTKRQKTNDFDKNSKIKPNGRESSILSKKSPNTSKNLSGTPKTPNLSKKFSRLANVATPKLKKSEEKGQ